MSRALLAPLTLLALLAISAPAAAQGTGDQPTDPTTGDPTVGDPTTGDPTIVDPTTGDPTTIDPTTGRPTTGGGFGGGFFPVDPDADIRGPVAVMSGVAIGLPLGLVAAWGATALVGAAADEADTWSMLRQAQLAAVVGDAVGVGAMLLVAWATDPEDVGELPFYIVPPAAAVAAAVAWPLAFAPTEGGAPALVGLTPWRSDDGAGVGAWVVW